MACFSFYHLLLFSLLLPLSRADPIGDFCNNDKSLSSDKTSANVDRVLAQLVETGPFNGFATASAGTGANQVYGLVQCRQDVSTEDCSACTADAAKKIRQRCPNQADARIWYDYCYMRYDIDNFIGKLDTGYGLIFYNVGNVTDGEAFNKEAGALMDRVRSQASVTFSRGLGKDQTKFSPFVTIYGLVQCTRDLSQLSCAQCLAIAIANFAKYCENSKGCQVNYSSCRARYEIYPFFFPLDSSKKAEGSNFMVLLYP